MLKEIKQLVKIVEAQSRLLICYRLGGSPRESDLDFLAITKSYLNDLKKWINYTEKLNE